MRVLVVEDEVDLANALEVAFRDEGFACDLAHEGEEALYLISVNDYDVIVLDLLLPNVDGRHVLERLRHEKTTPVLILTACDSLDDKVELIDSGADDYLTKPFQLRELISRVRALIRRSCGEPCPTVEIADVTLDTSRRLVTRSGAAIPLTPKEYSLLEFLVHHRGKVVSRTTLYDHIYGDDDHTLSNVLDVYVANLRKKLGHSLIQTRRGEGYLLDV